jgi:hypothetical protein
MDGHGSWRDIVFVERLWRSVKNEDVYLSAYDSAAEARSWIGSYLAECNRKRPHSSLDGRMSGRKAIYRNRNAVRCSDLRAFVVDSFYR